jgi:hypothetical protein
MTFNLVRIGWPNTAAILALATVPFMALATVGERHQSAIVAAEQTEAAANCLAPSVCSVLLAAADPQSALE